MKSLRTGIAHGSALIGRKPVLRLLWYFGVFLIFFAVSGLRIVSPGDADTSGLFLSAMIGGIVFALVHAFLFGRRADES